MKHRKLRDFSRQSLVIRIKGRQIRPQRHTRRAGERGKIQQQFRLALIGIGQRISQNKAAFASVLPISTLNPLRLV